MTAIYNLLSDSFYLKLATTCKNLFLSLVVVRLVIFLIQGAVGFQNLKTMLREHAHITPSTLGQFWTPTPPCVINIIMALDPPPP